MDTFFEQIVAIKTTVKTALTVMGIWVAFFVLSIAILFLTRIVPLLSALLGFVAIVIILMGYFAFKLTKKFSIEYEYIITNGCFDVDKIIARSSRKRMMTFEISTVEAVEKYNPNALPTREFKEKLFACNPDDPNAYYMIISEEGKGTRLLVFAPNERIKGAIKKFLPKYIANSAFKEM